MLRFTFAVSCALTLATIALPGCKGGASLTGSDCGDDAYFDREADACMPLTSCAPGTFVAQRGNTRRDRDCAPCEEGHHSDRDNAPRCDPWVDCPPGTHVAREGSPTRDRQCARCEEGHYSDHDNAARCIAWTDCPPGMRVTGDGSDSHDRQCEPCPEGSLTRLANLDTCSGAAPCPAGTVQTSPASATEPASCMDCLAGTYCAGDLAPAVDCGAEGEATWDHDGNPASPCTARTSCEPGSYVSDPGSATSDTVCEACGSGHFSAAYDAPTCSPFTNCEPGTYVSAAPTAVGDRECEPCSDRTQTTAANQASCVSIGECAPGTFEVSPADASTPAQCEACSAGEYCAGGSASPVDCPPDSWDDDADPSSECVPRTQCAPGSHVVDDGDALTDRSCDDCAAGHFSDGTNTNECVAWTDCPEASPGSSIRDRTCAEDSEWVRQFALELGTHGEAVGADAAGNVYVGGFTERVVHSPTVVYSDAFLRKFDAEGSALWTRTFNTGSLDKLTGLAIAPTGDVVTAGRVGLSLPGQTTAGNYDAFVRKYTADGDILWTRQFGSDEQESEVSVTVGNDGAIYVIGSTLGSLPGQFNQGNWEGFIRRYDPDGTHVWTRQISASVLVGATQAGVDTLGNVYVAGAVRGYLPGHTLTDASQHVFLAKYSAAGALQWTRQFGTNRTDACAGVVLYGDDEIYVAGWTGGAFGDYPSDNEYDVFVRRYDADGDVIWTRQFDVATSHQALASVAMGSDGRVHVAGQTWGAPLPDQTAQGGRDLFVVSYERDGTFIGHRQLGTSEDDRMHAVDARGGSAIYIAGDTLGEFPGEDITSMPDAFVGKLLR